MSVGAAPNLSGGLWVSGMSDSAPVPGNGAASTNSAADCGSPGSACYQNGASAAASTPGSAQAGVFAAAPGANPVGPPSPGCGCPPNPGGPNPSVPPTSGYSQYIHCTDSTISGFVSGLVVTCAETGVALTTACAGTGAFYQPDANTKHYSSTKGAGFNCQLMQGFTYDSGSVTAAGDDFVDMGVAEA
jgi:hypothetical protein